jgi:hypothetical protein
MLFAKRLFGLLLCLVLISLVFSAPAPVGTALPPNTSRGRDAAGAASKRTVVKDAVVQPSSRTASLPVDIIAPSIPTSLSAAMKDGRVNLRWGASRDNVGVISYLVYRDAIFVDRTTLTTFMDFPRPGLVHVYTVRATDAAGNRSLPAAISVSVPKRSSQYVGWDVFCGYARSAKDDPIVRPGEPGGSHLHDFFGNRTTDAFSTYGSMEPGGTTCALAEDRAGYWAPALYVDGNQALPGVGKSLLNGRRLDFKVRYYSTTSGSSGITYTAPPADLRMIVGVGSAKTPAENPMLGKRMWWGCTADEDRAIFPAGRTTAPRHCASGVVSIYMKFPDCWDGVHVDSPDHKSHVANSDSNNRCPASHPKHLPPIIYYIEYFVGTSWTTIGLASGGTSSVHADFWNTWNQHMLDRMTRDCFNAKIWCGTFR